MPRKPRSLALILAVLVATVLVLSAGWLFSPPPKQTQRLPDGSLLTLEAVTLDQQVEVVQGNRLQSILFPVLPAPVKEHLDWKVRSHRSMQPGVLTFWTSRRSLTPDSGWFSSRRRAVAIDEHGCEAEAGVFPRSFTPNAPVVDEFWEASDFPRRGNRVGLRIYTLQPDGRWTRSAEFTAPNPAHGPYPQWKPEPLPAAHRSGDLAVTLTSLMTGLAPKEPWRAARPDEISQTMATFRIKQGGVPTTRWHTGMPRVYDATGNSWPPASGARYEGDELRVTFPGRLSPDEPAFKLSVPFERTFGPLPSFPPGELWNTGSLTLPPSGTARASTVSGTRRGTQLRLLRLDRKQTLLFGRRVDMLTAQVRVDGLRVGTRPTLIRALDERGRAAELQGHNMRGAVRYYHLVPPPGAKRLELTFVLFNPDPRSFEWTVKPIQR